MQRKEQNNLVNENSHYLKKHVNSCINWYPWGEEAFNNAKLEDKPIFLSIGCSSCQGCDMMESEVVKNQQLVNDLNEFFINIKVDKDELPEVNSLYIDFSKILASGITFSNKPINFVLTPNRIPFIVCPYIKSNTQLGTFALRKMVDKVKNIWSNNLEKEILIQKSCHIMNIFAFQQEEGVYSEVSDILEIKTAAEIMFRSLGESFCKTKEPYKLPSPSKILFFLEYARETADQRALFSCERLLEDLCSGPMYDHIGGGVFGSVQNGFVPENNFEKTLFNNAVWAKVFCEAAIICKNDRFKNVAINILDYICRDIMDLSGAFVSAEDCGEVNSRQRSYTWTWDEIHSAVGKEDGDIFCTAYMIKPFLGIDQDRQGLQLINCGLQELSKKLLIPSVVLENTIKSCKEILLRERSKRSSSLCDDDIISGWNGMTISALIVAGVFFKESRFIEAALNAANFIKNKMYANGVLFHINLDGQNKHEASLEDYAYIIKASIDLFENGFGSDWLEFAIELDAYVSDNFRSENGGYYTSNGKDPYILLQRCVTNDELYMSANAIQSENSLRLYRITRQDEYIERTECSLSIVQQLVVESPESVCFHMAVINQFLSDKMRAAVLYLDPKQDIKEDIIESIIDRGVRDVIFVWFKNNDEKLKKLIPGIQNRYSQDDGNALVMYYNKKTVLPITKKESIINFL